MDNKEKGLFRRNRDIIKLAIPIFLQLILAIAIGNMDQFMISADQTAVNAIIQANIVTNVLVISFSVLATASIILITQFHGAGKKQEADKIYPLSFYLNLLIGIAISLLLYFGAEPIFSLMQVDISVIPDAVIYMHYTGAFIFLQALITAVGSFLTANRLMIQATAVTVLMNIVNIVLNAVFLYALGWGIKGVAVASTISRIAGLALIIILYLRHIKVPLSLKSLFPFPKRLLGELLRIGLPSAGENLSYNLSQTVIQIIINTAGILEGNVKGYVSNIVMLVYIFASGITQAMQVVEGEYLGGRQYGKADKLVTDTVKMSMAVSFGISLIILAAGYPLFRLMMATSSDPELAARLAVAVLAIDVILEQGRAGNIVLVRALQTSGDINYPVMMSVIFCWTVAVGGTFVFGHILGWGVLGCWLAMATDECSRALIFYCRWRGGKWRKLSLVDDKDS